MKWGLLHLQMKPPIALPPRLYVLLLGFIIVLFAGVLGGVVALAWTGKPIPPELGKAFTSLGAILGYGLIGAHRGDDDGSIPPGAVTGEVLPSA